MKRRLAIIPARGGSKRIPRKNIREFAGKPMISYALETAEKSKLFEKIHVSTEDLEVTRVVKELGFKIDFERPLTLSDDTTPIMPVLKFVVKKYQELNILFDEIWLIMACNPLIEPKDLVNASHYFYKYSMGSPVLAVTPYPVPIEWAFKMDDKNASLKPLNPGMFAISSKNITPKYFDAGSFSIWPTDTIINSKGAGTDNDFIGFPLPKSRCVDIDEEDDWQFAEALFRGKLI